jgi:hypothetical protein
MSLTKVTFSMIDGAVINVEDYGADSAAANNADAIEAAYAAAVTAECNLYFPKTYTVTRQLNLTGSLFRQNTKLVGAGQWESGIIYNGAATDAVLVVSNTTVVDRVVGFGIVDMFIDCNGLADTAIKNPSLTEYMWSLLTPYKLSPLFFALYQPCSFTKPKSNSVGV